MEAQAWTVIALLAATLLGAVFYLGNRIDGLSGEMRSQFQAQGARIDGLSGEMRSQFQAQGARIDAQGARIDALTARVEEQGLNLADRIFELGAKLDDHLRRHAS